MTGRTRHIPPGKEDLYRRQTEADATVERLDAELEAADRRARELAKVLDPDDSIVEDADAEVARLFDESKRATAVADRVYQERTAGLSSWIDHDPTAPICTGCAGAGCKTCRGWGREYAPPIPVWSDRDQEWVNPATGRTVDLLADPKQPTSPRPRAASPTSTGATAMPSIEETRQLIMSAVEAGRQALAELASAHSSLEDAQNGLRHGTEGSNQPEADQGHARVGEAVSLLDEAQRQLAAALQDFEAVAARL